MDRRTDTVLLVEGESDRAAIDTIAARGGHDLAAVGVRIEVMHGITNIGHHLTALAGTEARVGGLYDAPEQHFVRRALERTGLRAAGSGEPLDALGFFRCARDLEEEFIRALGVAGVLAILEAERDLDPFHVLQRQPAQRDRPVEAQLHRFFGSGAGRKLRYARVLAAAVPAERVPTPLEDLLVWALADGTRGGRRGRVVPKSRD